MYPRPFLYFIDMEHVCTTCHLPKSDDFFHNNGVWGKYTKCKSCCKKTREIKKDSIQLIIKKRQKLIRELVDSHKKFSNGISIPCLDCGVAYETYNMEFDHVNGEKNGCIANAWKRNWSITRLEIELVKCELICTGCHRIRTRNRYVEIGSKKYRWKIVNNPKICNKCKNIRDITDFCSRGICVECEAKRIRERKIKVKEAVNKFKDKPCLDCGIKRIPLLMDFDHINPNEKIFNISSASRNGITLSKIISEIQKCDVVCCYCHADRDHRGADPIENLRSRM